MFIYSEFEERNIFQTISVYGFSTVFIYLLFIFEVILSALDVDIEHVLS